MTLLKKLGEQVEEEGQSEALTYQKFEYWCATSQKSLEKTIVEEKATLEALSSEIDSYKNNIEVLGEEIGSLKNELLDISAGGSAADTDRTAGAKLYSEEQTALQSTIKAIGDAVTALETSKTNTDSGLLQHRVRAVLALVGTGISSSERSHLEEFADPKRPELKAKGDHDTHVKRYSFKSSSVIELLKELQAKFEAELLATNKAETNALNEYKLATAARTDLETAATTSKKVKEAEKVSAEGDLSTASQSQSDTQGDLDADSSTLGITSKSCRVKKSEWEQRTETRDGERAAIKAAIGILAKVSGVRTEAPGNPVPPVSPVSLLQLGNPDAKKAVQLLREEAHASHSKALEQLAQHIAAEKGPFDDAVNMIEKMIFRLGHEQKEEDDHKNWCDLELSKTSASIDDQDDKILELTTKINAAVATVAKLASDIVAADEMVGKIVKHVREATEIRETGKKENALAVKDAQEAQAALAKGIAVLKDFYQESGMVKKESWEFLQRAPVKLGDTPSTWSADYTGVSNPEAQPEGILSVLERVSADFAKMESETNAQEGSDQGIFEDDVKDCEIEKARRTKESEMKAQEKQRLIEKQQSMEASRKGVKGQKEATVQYSKDLQPACVEGSSTYKDRKTAREKEVKALKEAQTLLQGAFTTIAPETAPGFLQARRGL